MPAPTEESCPEEEWRGTPTYTPTTVTPPTCPTNVLTVGGSYTGCGLYIDESGEYTVDTEFLAGPGLTTDLSLGGCAFLLVDYGCGLTLSGNKLVVDTASLVGAAAGSALVTSTLSSGCFGLAVDLEAASTTAVNVVTDVELDLDGTVLTLSKWSRTHTIFFNAAGLPIDHTYSEAVRVDQSVALCAAFDLCDECLGEAAPTVDSSSASALEICEGESVDFAIAGTGGVGVYHYEWDFGDGTAESTVQNPTHAFTATGSYLVTGRVIDTCGRSATVTFTIDVVECWYCLDDSGVNDSNLRLYLGLYNTGVNDVGVTFDGDLCEDDYHYLVAASNTKCPADASVHSNWLANNSTSRWIAISCDTIETDNTTFDYTIEIVVPGDVDHTTLTVTGRWLTDDKDNATIDVLLNGVSQSPVLPGGGPTDFTVWGTFTLFGFVAGSNVITFRTRNRNNLVPGPDNPTGLRVEYLTATTA